MAAILYPPILIKLNRNSKRIKKLIFPRKGGNKFPSVEGYILKSVEGYILRKTEAIIYFYYFPTNFPFDLWQLYDIVNDFDKI